MNNKKIMIIGGTGALGKTLLKRYSSNNIILIFSRDEHKHVNIQKGPLHNKNVHYIIGDVKDRDSIRNAIDDFQPHVVINTAALKHVPICESNAYESVKVNIIGHQNIIDVIKRSNHRIETLIFVSTDKACKPINIYGMCKAISERLYIDFANKQTDIKTCLVRYGNVLESTGSVIPFFKKLLKNGEKYLPITHPEMTRFLLSLDQATDLIDWAYTHPNSHGKIAIPKIKSFLITDIAKSLIKSYDLEGKVTLKVIGVRPGEKLHEEMISYEEWLKTEDDENYLITDNVINDKMYSYNSKDSLMDFSEAYKLLQETQVI